MMRDSRAGGVRNFMAGPLQPVCAGVAADARVCYRTSALRRSGTFETQVV